MNRPIKDQILEWICIGAQVPYQSLDLLQTQSKIIQQAIYQMKKEMLIQVVGTGSNKELRLYLKRKSSNEDTYKVIDYIQSTLGKEYIEYYIDITSNHSFHGHIADTKRVMRGAEAIQMLSRAGVVVLPWEKKNLSKKDDEQDIGDPPSYYTTKQLNALKRAPANKTSADDAKKNFTRMYGLLMSKGGAYCVYNLDTGVLQWSENGEINSRNWIAKVLRKHWDMPAYMKVDRRTMEISCTPDAIYFIRNNETALKILKRINPLAKERAAEQGAKPKDKKQNTLTVYNKTHYVPISEAGIFQLWLITQEDYQERLKKSFKEDNRYPRYNRFDASTNDDTKKVITWFDGDLNRLSYINELMKTTEFSFIVECLPHQESLLNDYLCKTFLLVVFTEEQVIARLNYEEQVNEQHNIKEQEGVTDAQLRE